MVKVKVRSIGVGLAGASGLMALGHGGLGCAADAVPPGASQSRDGETGSTWSAVTASAGSATLDFGYGYGYGTWPNYELAVGSSTTDEYLRAGESVTVRFPASLLWSLLYPSASYPADTARAKRLRVAVTAHAFRNGAEVATHAVGAGASDPWTGDEFWTLTLEASSFVLDSHADAIGFSAVVTDLDDATVTATIDADHVRPMPVLGSDIPNKTWLLDSDGSLKRQRVLEGGAPVRSAALAVAYTDYRANTVADASSINREIGTYTAFTRFGTMVAPIYGLIVHEVAIGIDQGAGFHDEQPMAPNSASRLVPLGRTAYESRIAVDAKATTLRAYVHVKTYVVADYTPYGTVLSRTYAQGERRLVRETWDQPGGVGSNYEVSTEEPSANASFERTVIFVKGVTNAGQNLFLRGGVDQVVATRDLGRTCADAAGRPTYDCAMPLVILQYRNTTTAPWKGLDLFLDWYGREGAQKLAGGDGVLAEGTAADWTTDTWPAAWGDTKTVARDGYGVTPLNVYGAHYWMVDAAIDCTKAFRASDGTRWFEVKSFITGGPGWEADVAQTGAPYASTNHVAKCGAVSVFERGVATARFATLP